MKTIQLVFNPLYFRGPVFLLFYSALAACSWLFLKFFIRKRIDEKHAAESYSSAETDNPYELAYLRGGVKEVIKLAAYRVVKLKLFKSMKSQDNSIVRLERKNHYTTQELNKPEEIIYSRCAASVNYLEEVMKYESVYEETELYCCSFQNKLRDKNLLWDEHAITKLTVWKIIIIAGLVLVALTKIIYALSIGHQNIIFLFLLATISSALIYNTIKPPVTTKRASELLETLKVRYDMQRTRVDGTDEQLEFLLAGIFGLTILEGTALAFMHPFTEMHMHINWFNWNNWDFSTWEISLGSCSGGGGCSGGGSCGGGCGGGCGGCS
jgi:uncharacterized protein (TIGR04222 family)